MHEHVSTSFSKKHSNLSPDMQIETIIQCYSLERDKVGQEIGGPVVVAHKDGTTALLHLWQAMDNPPTRDGYKYHIRFPDGETVPFDAAYARIFGEKPVYRDNKTTKYPRLKRKITC